MSDDPVKRVCETWIASGYGNDCFWESFPECPTPDESLTANTVLDRIKELEEELHMLKTCGIIEVAIRNPNVMEYMQHWEGRALTAEAKLEKLEETVRIQSELIRYACGGVQSRINICLDRIEAAIKGE